MDIATLLEKAWDKGGAWCVVAIVLWIAISRIASWLKPWLESFFSSQIGLVDKLGMTTQEQASANQSHADANLKTAQAVDELRPMLEELRLAVCQKATA